MKNVIFVSVQQNYLLFIADKFATFCVTFVTEVKKKIIIKISCSFLILICFYFLVYKLKQSGIISDLIKNHGKQKKTKLEKLILYNLLR